MILKIVLTGGPSGGKSSAMKYLQTRLPEKSIVPVIVPELATMLFNSGIRWVDVRDCSLRSWQFQVNMCQSQMELEDFYEEFAKLISSPDNIVVLLCDRGVIDNFAYIPDTKHEFMEICLESTLNDIKSRYHGVIHLQTSALIDAYDDNNSARTETPHEAIKLDRSISELWRKGIQIYHAEIPNYTDFNDKLESIVNHIETIVNIFKLNNES